MSHIETTAARINSATCPEDLFGYNPAEVNDAYRALAKVIHPDHCRSHPKLEELAAAAFKRLNELMLALAGKA